MDASTMILVSRTEAGLTQRALAELAGTSSAAICLYETGQRIPRVDTLTRLIAATGRSIEIRVREKAGGIDVAGNAQALEAVLDLVEHLPQRHSETLDVTPFAELAR